MTRRRMCEQKRCRETAEPVEAKRSHDHTLVRLTPAFNVRCNQVTTGLLQHPQHAIEFRHAAGVEGVEVAQSEQFIAAASSLNIKHQYGREIAANRGPGSRDELIGKPVSLAQREHTRFRHAELIGGSGLLVNVSRGDNVGDLNRYEIAPVVTAAYAATNL